MLLATTKARHSSHSHARAHLFRPIPGSNFMSTSTSVSAYTDSQPTATLTGSKRNDDNRLMMTSSYDDILRRLYSRNASLSRLQPVKQGLENIRTLDRLLEYPSRNCGKLFHVAGTNGKGSTCWKIEHFFRTFENRRTGLFVSPHISSLRERVQIGGQAIDELSFRNIMSHVLHVADSNDIPATFFELITAFSFFSMAERNVDISVIETGLGGRLDATNIVENPHICIITSIGLDHTNILGNTIEQISMEKAGIVKSGVPLVVGPPGKDVPDHVFRAVCKEKKAPYFPDLNFEDHEAYTWLSNSSSYSSSKPSEPLAPSKPSEPLEPSKPSSLPSPDYNLRNTRLALRAINLSLAMQMHQSPESEGELVIPKDEPFLDIAAKLTSNKASDSIATNDVALNLESKSQEKLPREKDRDRGRDNDSIATSVYDTCPPCRYEKVVVSRSSLRSSSGIRNSVKTSDQSGDAVVACDSRDSNDDNKLQTVLDVAHNPTGISELFARLVQEYGTSRPIHVVMAMCVDKNVPECLEIVLTHVDPRNLTLTQAQTPRTATLEDYDLYLEHVPSHLEIHKERTVKQAIRHAIDHAFASRSLSEIKDASHESPILVVCGSLYMMSEAREELGITEYRDNPAVVDHHVEKVVPPDDHNDDVLPVN